MVFSIRNKEYNDPSVQDLGDWQHDEGSNQHGGSHLPLNLEVEFPKLQKLVQAQAKEIATLKKKEQVRKGKEKVVEDDPIYEIEKQP